MTCLDGATIGAKFLLLDDGHSRGSLGDPVLDQEVSRWRWPIWLRGCSRTVSVALPQQTVRIFVEVHTPPATLLIVGASQVAMALVQIARLVGFHTIVVDSRPRFATPERFPTTDTLLVGIPSEMVSTLPLSPQPRWFWWRMTTNMICRSYVMCSRLRWVTSAFWGAASVARAW